MKKILAMILCLVLALSLVACGGKESKVSKETTPETEAATQPTVNENIDETEDTSKVVYKVTVEDENGMPFSNLMVQLCDENGCNPRLTEEDGTAIYEVNEYRDDYHANVTVLPEGYEYASGEENHYFEENSTELTIVLRSLNNETETTEDIPADATESASEEDPVEEVPTEEPVVDDVVEEPTEE